MNSVYKYGISYLKEKILNNLVLTKDILKWNIENDIYMYRATSKLLPLVTHPDIIKDFKWRWYEDQEILKLIKEIKDFIIKYDIRLSMHPDQFTVLNSKREDVVENSIKNLEYHATILSMMGGTDLILHAGGVYGDKKNAIKRFIDVYETLDIKIKNLLRLENDDKSYNIEDVLNISECTGIPIVLDIHHHKCNKISDIDKIKIDKIDSTWKKTKLIPKMHISSGKTSNIDRSHSDYINCDDFFELLNICEHIDFDLMVEAKEKDRAVLELRKCVLK